MDEPLAGALSKLTDKGGRAIRALPDRGRQLVKHVPPPVQIQLARLSSRGAHVCREIFAGIFVVGLIVIVLGYGRLARGPVSLPTLVPPIEQAINEQLQGLTVQIDDAVIQRSPDGPGVVLRLRNIRLIDTAGEVTAQAPLAAIGLSGSALLSGKIAPGSVDFIGSRLMMTYSEDKGLSLAFSKPGPDGEALMRGALPDGPGETASQPVAESPSNRRARGFNLTTAANEIFERVRRSDTSYLTRFGLKDSIVVLYRAGHQTLWQVPDFTLNLEHDDDRSIIVGQADVASSRGDWELEVRTAQEPRTNGLEVEMMIENLVPSGVAGNFPTIGLLRALDMAVDGEGVADLARNGDFIGGEMKLRLAPGPIRPPWDPDTPVRIDHGDVTLRYIEGERVVELAPSTVRWGKTSYATFSGTFRPVLNQQNKVASWTFDIKADDAVLGVEEFGLGPTKVDALYARGSLSLKDGNLNLSEFVFQVGNAKIAAKGRVTDGFGAPTVRFSGDLSPMSVDMLKQFWPKFLAGKARQWVLERVNGGQVLGGSFNIALTPKIIEAIRQGEPVPKRAIRASLNFADTDVAYIPELPPLRTGEGVAKISGTTFSVSVPAGTVHVGQGMDIAISDGNFFVPDLRDKPQEGITSFRGSAPTPAVMALLDHQPFGFITAVGLKPDFLGGTATGEFTMSMPLIDGVELDDMKLNGVARLENAITPGLVGDLGIEGGAVDVELTSQGVSASGNVRIKDVPALVYWQRVFNAPDSEQPPISVTATLDGSAREKLGLKLNDIVKGPMPVTLYFSGLGEGTAAPDTSKMKIVGDLTGTELRFDPVGWKKPSGQNARLSLDVDRKPDGATNLENFQITGPALTILGSVALDAANELQDLTFSKVEVGTDTKLSITARRGPDNILRINAEGPTYDGRDFFRAILSADQLTKGGAAHESDADGMDLTAKVGRLMGYDNTVATNVTLSATKRAGELEGLKAFGELAGNKPVTVALERSEGARILTAEAANAGAAFKLIGLYRSMQGGQASLRVNMDAGTDKKSGTLRVLDFDLVGDSVVADVLSDPSSTAALGQERRDAARRISFRQLRAPFLAGQGKFQLNDAYVNGPELGATLRGTIDFKSRKLDLGGTYVPLYGLNSALGAVPVLGRVFVGRQGEGVVGITFAIKGNLDDPTVLVNPMSIMTPGIFRQIFDFNAGVAPATAATETAKPRKKRRIRPFENARERRGLN